MELPEEAQSSEAQNEPEAQFRQISPAGAEHVQFQVTLAATNRAEVPAFVFRPRGRQNKASLYRPVPEVTELLSRCHEAGQGREITAALRIMREQLEARDSYHETGAAARTLAVLLWFILLVLLANAIFQRSKAIFPLLTAPAVIIGFVVVSNRVRLFQARKVVDLYRAERREIEDKAASIIAEYPTRDSLPHRLYEEHVRELDRMAKLYPRLEPIARAWNEELWVRSNSPR